MIDRNQLQLHQLIKSDINFPYKNVGELFATKTKQMPEKTFLICPGKQSDTFSFESFKDKYLQVAKYLIHLGLKKGDRLNLIFSNSPEFLLFYFAGLILGITVVPINPDIAPEEMLYIIKDSDSKAVFYEISLRNRIEKIKNKILNKIITKAIKPMPYFEPLLLNDFNGEELSIP
ncbi:MAG: AMP-binding protein, partial [Promethearchaeota archaeon]